MKKMLSLLIIVMAAVSLAACSSVKVPDIEKASEMSLEELSKLEGTQITSLEKAWGKPEVVEDLYFWRAQLDGGVRFLIASAENGKVTSLGTSLPLFVTVSEVSGDVTYGFIDGKEYQFTAGCLAVLPDTTFFGEKISYEIGDMYYFESNGIIMKSFPAQITNPYAATRMGCATDEELAKIEAEMTSFHEGMGLPDETDCECAEEELPALIMIDETLYFDTGEISDTFGCGVMDGTITSMTAGEIPTENNQSNFGEGYGYQIGATSGTIDVNIGDEWHIFKRYQPDGSAILPTYEYIGDDKVEKAVTEYIFKNFDYYMAEEGSVTIPAFCIFQESAEDDFVKVYGNFWQFVYVQNGSRLDCISGGELPGVIYLKESGDGYVVDHMDRAGDGADYAKDIKGFCNGNETLEKQYFSATDTQQEPLKSCRTWYVKQYVDANGLVIDSYKDYGWDPVMLSESETGNMEEDNSSVSIIGGADGPTAVFIKGKPSDDNKDGYLSIPMDAAKDLFTVQGDYVIVDVRRADEYAEGHIPGAINIANESIGKDAPAELPDKAQTIFIYCRSGRRSKEASKKLATIGYENIIEFGGIQDWTGEIEK